MDVFRESEERFLIEWTASTTDEEVATLAFAVTKVLKSLDLFVEDTFSEDTSQDTLQMYAELRNPEDPLDEAEDVDHESQNLHKL